MSHQPKISIEMTPLSNETLFEDVGFDDQKMHLKQKEVLGTWVLNASSTTQDITNGNDFTVIIGNQD